MNLLLEARDVAARKRRNKLQTLLIMCGFSATFAILGYGFDSMMARFNDYQVVTVPVAAVIVTSLFFNCLDALNERFSGLEGLEGTSQYYANKATIWMASTSFVLIAWMLFHELAYIDPHTFGRPVSLLVFGQTSPYGMIVGSCLGVAAAFSALQWGAYSVLRSVEALPADRTFEADRRVTDIVASISSAAGMPAPAVYVVQDDTVNLFSIGRSPKHASIVVSQGLIENLKEDEIKAAIAHEISHIRSYDIRIRTAATALFGSVLLLAHWSRPAASKGRAASIALPLIRKGKNLLVLLFWLASLLVVPVATYALILLTFRHREYIADVSAAELTHDPDALISALTTIERDAASATVFRANVAHLCIIDPLKRIFNTRQGWLADVLATHPPTSQRILVLQSLSSRVASLSEAS